MYIYIYTYPQASMTINANNYVKVTYIRDKQANPKLTYFTSMP